jgi:hypothetical protein
MEHITNLYPGRKEVTAEMVATYDFETIEKREAVAELFQVSVQRPILQPRTHHGRVWAEVGSNTAQWKHIFVMQASPDLEFSTQPLETNMNIS